MSLVRDSTCLPVRVHDLTLRPVRQRVAIGSVYVDHPWLKVDLRSLGVDVRSPEVCLRSLDPEAAKLVVAFWETLVPVAFGIRSARAAAEVAQGPFPSAWPSVARPADDPITCGHVKHPRRG